MSTNSKLNTLAAAAIIVAAVLALPACPPGETPDPCQCTSAKGDIVNPADFVETIDNPFFPLVPGTTFIYEGETDEGTETTEVVVTDQTIEILGVTCTVVHDTVSLEGSVIEDTYDWYAQDVEGNVWYFGEASMEVEDGVITGTFGSWKAGVDCAEPGIVMLADPRVDETYRQEFYQCVAEDMATVLALDESITVPFGSFDECLRTEDFTPLDPSVDENKVYASGVGFVAGFHGTERTEELISITMP